VPVVQRFARSADVWKSKLISFRAARGYCSLGINPAFFQVSFACCFHYRQTWLPIFWISSIFWILFPAIQCVPNHSLSSIPRCLVACFPSSKLYVPYSVDMCPQLSTDWCSTVPWLGFQTVHCLIFNLLYTGLIPALHWPYSKLFTGLVLSSLGTVLPAVTGFLPNCPLSGDPWCPLSSVPNCPLSSVPNVPCLVFLTVPCLVFPTAPV